MKKITFLTLLILTLLITGCVSNLQKTEQTEDLLDKFNQDMSFVLTQNGVQKEFSKEQKNRLHYYFDVSDENAQRIHQETQAYLREKTREGSLEIMYHPVYFKQISDDTQNARRKELMYNVLFNSMFNSLYLDSVFDGMDISYLFSQDKTIQEVITKEEKVSFETIFGEDYKKSYNKYKETVINKIPKYDKYENFPILYFENDGKFLDTKDENSLVNIIEVIHKKINSFDE